MDLPPEMHTRGAFCHQHRQICHACSYDMCHQQMPFALRPDARLEVLLSVMQGLESSDQLGPLALIGAGGLAGMAYWVPV